MVSDNTVKPVNFRDVAERVMSTIPLFVMQDDSTFYVYENGVYISDGAEPILNRAIRSIADDMNIDRGFTPNPVNRKFVAEVFDYIRVHKVIPRNRIGSKLHILNLKNGLLNLENMEFTEHDPKYYSIIQYPVKYDPAAECKTIWKFLEETVQPGDLETLVEYTGYSLVPGNSFKVLAMLYGGRDAGKSTYCNLVEAMFGKQYTAHVPPQTIQENKFAASQLYGKVLNIVPDIGDKPLSGTESIKTLLGNDEITADQKYKSGIHFVNKSHIFWGANKIPDIKNDDIDFYDKVLMVNFPHRFDETNADRTLISRMTSETELSGFLNLLIAARARLIERGKFKKTETGSGCMTARDRYRIESNPVEYFLERYTVPSLDDISKTQLHAYYRRWCETQNIKSLAINMFGKRLKSLGYEDARSNDCEFRARVWLGVAYREPATDSPSSSTEGSGQPDVNCLDTGRREEGKSCNENDSMSRLSTLNPCSVHDKTLSCPSVHVYSSINKTRKKDNIVYRDTVGIKSPIAINLADPGNLGGQPGQPGHAIDLVKFVHDNYPNLVVDDMTKLIDDFCIMYPVYGMQPGPDALCQLALILKERGWK